MSFELKNYQPLKFKSFFQMFKKNKKIKQLLQAQMIIKGTQNYENF